ncbi:MAG TPA: DNA-binding protein [Bacilli bacterium]|nr:DNA-binding protein [Candidatus Paceibacterota bacterium]HPB49584.1 DNA-binding protein [Bacilli bacterium]
MEVKELLNKPYLDEKEVSAITNRALSTLRNERFMRKGLPYYKIGGRSVRYKTEDVISYMEGRRITFDEVAE